MSEHDEEPHPLDGSVKPNVRPGPTDEGGHGGMATREQEERLWEQQHDTGTSNDVAGTEDTAGGG
ncbi:hypothetical protein GIS00_13335 [Nakamurella sp. YIM 132087]|uniref:Uncharacterized protein n=1 Tax=Nakamurella alba TaxID=2665158 RepID=A0A7K1FNX3_9ACTN|nr:hypothetical protein [Nakamurella alba]MTD14923.1 hypothetical protein [Nakamurella alba]